MHYQLSTIHVNRESFLTSFHRALHSVLVLDGVLRRLQIRENHLLHERVEVDLALPPEQLLRLCGVAEEQASRIQVISDVAPRRRG